MKLTLIASGVGLFGLGALVGWAFTADRAEVKMRSNVEDLEELKERLRSKSIRIGELEAELDVVRNPEEIESGGKIEEVSYDDIPQESPEETRENLQKLINTYTSNPDDVDTFVDRARQVVAEGANDVPPFVISRAKYSWDEEEGDEYAKITITYYPTHRVLLDDDQDPVDNVDALVGWRNLNRFGDESEDPDVVFIRNRRLETDFEVVREEGELPTHVKYGMPRSEFEANKNAGRIRFREEDM